MNPQIESFITAARTCVYQLWENASYVRRELPTVSLPESLRQEVETLCDTWLEAKHDALSELEEIAGAGEVESATLQDLANRCLRVQAILCDVIEPTDRVVRKVHEVARTDPGLRLAVLLVTESATNILQSTPEGPTSP